MVRWFDDSGNASVFGLVVRLFPHAILAWLLIGMMLLIVTAWALKTAPVDQEWAICWLAGVLLSPLGWVYYHNLAAGPLVATFRSDPSWMWRVAVIGLCIPAPLLINLLPSSPAVTLVATSIAGLSTLLLFVAAVRPRAGR